MTDIEYRTCRLLEATDDIDTSDRKTVKRLRAATVGARTHHEAAARFRAIVLREASRTPADLAEELFGDPPAAPTATHATAPATAAAPLSLREHGPLARIVTSIATAPDGPPRSRAATLADRIFGDAAASDGGRARHIADAIFRD